MLQSVQGVLDQHARVIDGVGQVQNGPFRVTVLWRAVHAGLLRIWQSNCCALSLPAAQAVQLANDTARAEQFYWRWSNAQLISLIIQVVSRLAQCSQRRTIG